MSNNLKIIIIKLFSCLSLSLIISSCTLFDSKPVTKPLTAKEQLLQKAQALMLADHFKQAEPLLLSLVAEPENNVDPVYNFSLWNLSLVYEKLGSPDKAILVLNQLVSRNPENISTFKINASLMKNYFLVGNQSEALKYKKVLDGLNPKLNIQADAMYLDLLPTLNLNYDQLVLQELEYLNEIQKYLLFVMEQKTAKSNALAADSLITIYQRIYSLTEKDQMNKAFKEKILIALIDNLNRFNLFKLDDLNLNPRTVVKFSIFSEKLKKQITERLHQ